MTTILRNVKLPADTIKVAGVKVKSVAGSKRLAEVQALKPAKSMTEMFGADAVTPSVKGRQGITPSTFGIAAQARFTQLAKVAAVAAGGLSAITTIRDSAEAAAYPELAALANDPKFMAVIQRVVGKICKEVDSFTRDSLSAARNEVAGSEAEREEINKRIAEEEGLVGCDTARPILTAEDLERVAAARAKLSRLRTAQAFGDAGEIVGATFGFEPRAYDSDDMDRLMDRLEGKRSK